MALKRIDLFLFVPGVPLGAIPNGVCTYAKNLVALLDQTDVAVTLIAKSTVGEATNEAVYEYYDRKKSVVRKVLTRLIGIRSEEGFPARRFSKFAARLARNQRSVVEMEEVFGHSLTVGKYVKAPVAVRLHGPWFLVGSALGVNKDAAYHDRVRREGDAIFAAAAVSAPSRFVLDEVEKFYDRELNKKIVLPNPFPEYRKDDQWRGAVSESQTAIFIGRFDLVKGADIFIEAAFLAAKKIDGFRAIFVGPDGGRLEFHGCGNLSRDEVIAECERRHGISSPVEFLGRRPAMDVTALRKDASLCVVASRVEMFSYTVAESLAQGVPTVASRVGGIPEMIIDGVNGLLFESEDANALASQIETIVRDPALAERLSHAALHTVRTKYSGEALRGAYLDFYNEIAN